MDLMTITGYVISLLETTALFAALVLTTAGLKAGKNSPEKKKYYRLSALCIGAFLVLKIIRTAGLGI